MDLSSIVNPYDFSHPVTDPELFFGRAKELGEIGYYLEQAAKTKRPVSLAIIGDRAAGKTSLLNIIETESVQKKLLPVRIDLDQTDIKDELRFFHKILNALLIKAFDEGYFGGKAGRTYATYLDMVSAYVVPESFEFVPWTFPIQFAKARANNRSGVALDDASFKEDLKKTSKEITQTIVLIFDECNVFKLDQYVLQKIRNIFMNLPGYMLVFSGTMDLFPIMDEIFSPIIRQFKKIEVGAFSRINETQKCIEIPLSKAGIMDKHILKLLSVPDIVLDIHQLSGGKPYEIQLICHMLMRRCQMGQAKKFLLNVNVLEEIRSELATGQNITERPVITAARGLSKRSLEALGILCGCEELVSFDQIWGGEWTLHRDSRWKRDQLLEQKQLLVSLGIVDDRQQHLRFSGDEFDRIYLKYVARQKQVSLTSWKVPSEAMFWFRLEHALSQRWQGFEILGRISLNIGSEDPIATAGDIEKKELDEAFFETFFAEELVSTLFAPDHAKAYVTLYGTLQTGNERSAASLLWPIVNDAKLEKLLNHLNDMMSRAKEIGWDLKIQSHVMKKPDPMSIAKMIKGKASGIFNARMASTLGNYLATAYITNRDKELSQKYVDCILMLAERPRSGDLNNIGYVALSRGDYESAERFLSQALQSNERIDTGLTLYNLAVCRLLAGKTSEALSYLRRAKEEPETEAVGCIISVEEYGHSLVPKEIFDIDNLGPHITDCIELCSKLQADQSGVTS